MSTRPRPGLQLSALAVLLGLVLVGVTPAAAVAATESRGSVLEAGLWGLGIGVAVTIVMAVVRRR